MSLFTFYQLSISYYYHIINLTVIFTVNLQLIFTDIEERRKEEQSSQGFDNDDKEFPNKGRDTFIAVVFGLTVVFTYAVLRAGISIIVEDVEDDFE